MSVKVDETGRRTVQAEIEVPGSPEEVWRAIATGPGISSWFVPTVVEERVGGKATASFGPGMDSLSTITVWEAPQRTVAESKDLGPDAPTIASEWTVEAGSGGTCRVRVVHSLFADSDNWDKELEAWEAGWPEFLRILNLYLTHFRGEPCTLLPLSASTSISPGEAWKTLTEALGVADATEGARCEVGVAGMISVEADVERVGKPPHAEELLLRTGAPLPGLAHFFALKMGKQTTISLRFYVYGEAAPMVVDGASPFMGAWLNGLFPPAPEGASS